METMNTEAATKANHYIRTILATLAALMIAASMLARFAGPAEASFPGQNGRIVFASTRDGNSEIYARVGPLGNFGSLVVRLTNNGWSDRDPAVSPDGQRIAFVSNRDGNAEIYTMKKDGSDQTRLTTSAAMDINPAFSPNGTKIVFVSYRDGNPEVYEMNADGTGTPVNLTNNPANEFQPNYSPDGSAIAFVSDRDGNDEVYIMGSDGSNAKNLTQNPAEDGSPSFSPDGKWIAFDSNRADPAQANIEIYIMKSGGEEQTRLTYNAGPGFTDLDFAPSFSPSGSMIAFVSYRDGNYEVYSMSVKGAYQTNLTKHWAGDTDPNWGPMPID
jgi:Tol biopolymer transport system component